MRTGALGLTLLLLAGSLAGCAGLTGGNGGGGSNESISAPTWEVGDWWLYTFSTPDYSDDTARLVVASDSEEGGTAYMLAISSETEARRHAVLNHNPFLGRITHDNLSAFENGIPQPVLNFPLEEGASWIFTLFSNDWTAIVLDTTSKFAVISAQAADGARLDYTYDAEVGFFASFIWTDADGINQLRMQHAAGGEDHTGTVYFVRGGDLYSDTWDNSGPDAELRDTFFVSDHPSDGGWDEMIYLLDAECGGGGSSISLTLRDHSSISALERIWGPGASEYGTLGTIPYPSEEYTLTLTFTGDTHLRLRIAGGITQSWTL
tara:strand:+ start:1119 stop:2078 length:960 start_codon:yes stop_codon:yes gene_type:complete